MNHKQKILDALDLTIDDLDENRLLDVLLDAYQGQKRQISLLKGENAHERETLYAERERMREEYHRMRSDPLYCADGQYFFLCNGRRFLVSVKGYQMELIENAGDGFTYLAQRLSREEFNK